MGCIGLLFSFAPMLLAPTVSVDSEPLLKTSTIKPVIVLAQAGSTGGTIGKQGKSVSGDQEQTGRPRAAGPARKPIFVRAAVFNRSSGIEIASNPAWTLNSIHSAAPYIFGRMNLAEYDFTAAAGRYRLEVEYAAAESRAVEIFVNGVVVSAAGLAAATGGWSAANQQWLLQGEVQLRSGRNTLRFKRDSAFPHIRAFRFVPN